MPTSVLLAVLAAAGLLALAPALVRRYDATERLVAERALSTARVIPRGRRRLRTVPGRRPLNPPRAHGPEPTAGLTSASMPDAADSPPATGSRPGAATAASSPTGTATGSRMGSTAASSPTGTTAGSRMGSTAGSRTGSTAGPRTGTAAGSRVRSAAGSRTRSVGRKRRPRVSAAARRRYALRRRRRVFAALVLLNIVEVVGVIVADPGFWIGLAVSALLLVAFAVRLRQRTVTERRRRRDIIHAAHRAQARREAAARAAAARAVAEREARRTRARREAVARAAARIAAAERAALGLAPDLQERPGLRGRPYEARAVNF